MENILIKLKKKYTLSQTISSVKSIVKPVFMRLSLEKAVEKFNRLPEEYRTDWSKLLMDIDKSRGVLETLIKALFGVYNGEMVGLNDLDMTTARKYVTMIFANTKDKEQQRKFTELIQQVLGSNYLVKLINSDETNNRKAEEDTKKIIARAKRENKKVVLVSKDMASRSFSVSEIDTVMLMFDRGSYATIAQKISRVLTPGKTFNGEDKIYGHIISLSLDPNREDISPIDEYIVYEAEKVEVNDLNDGIQRVLRSVQILTNGEGGEVELEKDVYGEQLINSSSLIKLGCETSKVDKVIVDSILVNVLLGIEVPESVMEKLVSIDSSKVKRTKDKPQTKEEKELNKKMENIRTMIKERLDMIVKRITQISEINNRESDDIVETLTMIEEKGFCNDVIYEVGINCEMVKQIIMVGGLSYKLLNTIISSYNKEEVVLF